LAQRLLLAAALLAVLSAGGGSSSAQQPPGQRGVRGVADVHTVVRFSDLDRQETLAPRPFRQRRVTEPKKRPPRPPVPPDARVQQVPAADAAKAPAPLVPAPVLAASFPALGDNNTSIPPDTQGAAGPNHVMTTLNTQVRIQNKAGGNLSTVSLDGFWASTGAVDPFDPKLLYDPFANRWIFVAVSSAQDAASSVLIGTSQTNDPTGNWDLFREDADAADTVWADYPSVGFNKDWIVVTVNMFTNAGNNFTGMDIYAFKKADLYAGGPATFTRFSDTSLSAFTQAPAITYDNTLATMYLVEDFNGNFMNNGFIRVSTITGSVGAEVYTAGSGITAFVGVPFTWGNTAPGGVDNDFAPQQGSSELIQVNDSRMLSLVYRNGSLWAAQTAFLPAVGVTRSAVQWWQFQPSAGPTLPPTLQQFGRVDDSTGTMFFAFPSLAVNAQNDVLIGYSTFAANQFAGSAFSFRAAGDPISTLRSGVPLKAGEASYFKTFGGSLNRWGDYSNTVVDPANHLDFWTIQMYAATPAGGGCAPNCDRWGTWWGKVVPVARRRGQLVSQ
jgi:hypothetical protein